MSYNTTKKVRTKDLKSLAAKTKTLNDNVKSSVGTLSSLTTSTKTSLVAAINELLTQRGALSSLTTPNKTSIVLAINEVWDTLNERTSILTATGLAHNSWWRGKNLGNTITDAQLAAIRNSSFTDLWLGDYWIVSGNGRSYTLQIMHFNYNNSNQIVCLVGPCDGPNTGITGATDTPANRTGTYNYKTCYWRTNTRLQILADIEAAIGSDKLLPLHSSFPIIADDYTLAGFEADYESTIELPTAAQLFGMPGFVGHGTAAGTGSIQRFEPIHQNTMFAGMQFTRIGQLTPCDMIWKDDSTGYNFIIKNFGLQDHYWVFSSYVHRYLPYIILG